ncbi:MAG: hypothetical protein ACRDRI_19575 [Pseudonocardiaceae bacterium]
MSGALPWFAALAGRLDEHVIDSVLLRDNPLGDPARYHNYHVGASSA